MSLMVLGTSSHAGKSSITAGICRILSDRGIPVAPFKAQNMSLNSYITEEGAEIGIAQATQAFAARALPVADMNPVLLKPKGNAVSQVVLLGKPWKDTKIADYYTETEYLLAEAVAAYDRLKSEYTNIIVEGAGGAAEVNLYDRDIANIQLAKRLQIPIILVGDIERGGIFAQIYGTIALLPDDVRPLVKGIIVNKFRGDAQLFESGRKILEDLTGIPVLGIVPWMKLALPEEDSLSLADKIPAVKNIRVAVIRYPHISNFTDFSLLEEAAAVEYVEPGTSLDAYDAVILPGTKNTVDDLAVLRSSGAADQITAYAKTGKPVIGICGGYQMMGTSIFDNAIEGEVVADYEGLNLLPVHTIFDHYDKITRQVKRVSKGKGPILSRMNTASGYEIHSGKSSVAGAPAFTDEGCVDETGLLFGTYMHGLFANAEAVDALVGHLAEKKNVPYTPAGDAGDPYAALARHLESCLDVERIVALSTVN
ncbi:cobyric acid synthase [Methanorbis rubei]|uniref:Probable cobyric acid synthase n=1 Tax=Methanorbis rubei TaxID=3028300 RepID=A0AAE4SE36_9EURY|nr:Cobyric acid synthase [Methanocorpusculaceae archaeon Cs1]